MKTELLRTIMFITKNTLGLLLIQIISIQFLLASNVEAQYFKEVKITISAKNATPVEIFEKIEELTEFKFGYNRSVSTIKSTLTFSHDNESLRDILLDIAKETGLQFQRINNSVSVIKPTRKLEEKEIIIEIDRTISGKITDADGNPLIGATVRVKGVSIGTVTDVRGNFSLSVPDNAQTLEISFVGFLAQEVSIGTNSSFEVELEVDTEALSEVVITGYRQQNQLTIQNKRQTPQIADFLTQDNIGRLPDFAAADAARRIAGVNVVFEEDEATQIGIRGLPPIYTFSTIDGLAVPSADRNTRVANFEVIPSAAISSIEVYKSRTPDLDGNAIGGVFNLKTRSAYDTPDRFLTGRATIGKFDFDEVPRSNRSSLDKNGLSVRSDVTFADQFGSDNQFGIVLSGIYNRKDRDELKAPRASYSFVDDDQTKPIPNRFRVNAYDNIIDRFGGLAKFEFKPNENFYAAVTGNFFRKTDDEVRYETRIDALSFDTLSLTPNGGRFTSGRNRFANNIFEIEHQVSSITFDTYYQLNEKSKLDFKFGYTEGLRGEDGPGATFRVGPTTDFSGTFEVDDEQLKFTLDNPSFYLDPSNYPLAGIDGFTRVDEEDYTAFSLNYDYNTEGLGFGFKTGFKYRSLNHRFDQDNLSVSYVGTDPLQLSNFILDQSFQPDVVGQQYLVFDPYALIDYIGANPSQFTIPAESTGTLYGRGIVDNPAAEFNIEEKVTAGYVMGVYNATKFNVIGGFRIESTNSTTSRPIRVDGVFDGSTSSVESDYVNVLPSLAFTYNFDPATVLKTSYSKAIGRADYGQLAPSEVVDIANDVIQRGNPNLKPRISNNYDLSIEKYFAEGSSLFSFGFFHKRIKDDIVTESSFEGDNEVFTPVNIDGLAVTGAEFNFIKSDFDFLPGFLTNLGLSSNYTFIVGERFLNDGQRLAAVPNLPRNSFNTQLFYQVEKFDARIAWNWIDQTLVSVRSGQEFNNRFLDSYSQWDFAANYFFMEKVSAFFEIRNFTNENRTFVGGPNQSLVEEDNEFGGSIWVGLNFKL